MWSIILGRVYFRQFWTAKALWGGITEDYRALNFVPDAPFKSLDGKTYLELGTGVDNIFKVLRFDFVWKVLPTPLPTRASERWGIFGSFRLAF